MTLLRELIPIPEHVNRGDFVLHLTEGILHSEETLRDYVVTPQLSHCFQDALKFIQSALETRSSKATYLHGSFGSGKSHFMAVLHLLLRHDPAAREHPDLAPLCAKNRWVEKKKFLLVPFHMIGATSMESAILGGYEAFVREQHPEAPAPAVYKGEQLFEDARKLKDEMGAERFLAALNRNAAPGEDDWGELESETWTEETFASAVNAPPGSASRVQLLQDLLARFFSHYPALARDSTEAFVSLDEGLAVLSQHARKLGYDALILFLDELVLWLASRAADLAFVHQEGQKLTKLVEAQHADRPIPIVSFIARQRDLRELVGEQFSGMQQFNFGDALKHWEGRFHVINLEDRNLPEIASRRLLKPVSDEARRRIDESFEALRLKPETRDVLLTAQFDQDTFRKIYPFSPALMDTLVAVSSLLQRERTALRIMMELLSEQRDTLELGQIVPVGDLYELVSAGQEAWSRGLRDAFDNANRLRETKFLPLLEAKHEVRRDHPPGEKATDEDRSRWRSFLNDDRLVKTLLLSALVPQVEALGGLTPSRLAALNHGTIRAPIRGQEAQMVLTKLQQWAPHVGELRLAGEETSSQVSLELSSVDVERILEQVQGEDNPGNRKRKLRELLFQALSIQEPASGEFGSIHSFLWRGTVRQYEVVYMNIRETEPAYLEGSDDLPRLVLDFPFDEGDYSPNDDLRKLEECRRDRDPSRTLLWLPSFLSKAALRELGRLCQLDALLRGDQLDRHTSHLAPADRPQARLLLENQQASIRASLRRALNMAYGIEAPEAGVLEGGKFLLPLEDQFQSLDPSLPLGPVTGSSLADALRKLLEQELAYRYPGHPEFPGGHRIRPAAVRAVWAEIRQAVGQSEGRLRVKDKKTRDLLKQIAVPLNLGSQNDDIFVLSPDWKRHLERKFFEAGSPRNLRVADLDAWIDQPRVTGLPNPLRRLIVLTFAAQTNRVLLRGERLFPDVEPDQVTPDMLLVEQDLPDEAQWSEILRRVQLLFDLSPPGLRNAETLHLVAGQVRDKVRPLAQAARKIPGQMAQLLGDLGLDTESSPRLATQRMARELVDKLDQGSSLECLQHLANSPLPDPPEALKFALEQGPELLAEFHGLSEVVRALKPHEGHETVATLLGPLRNALERQELAEPLAPELTTVRVKGPRTLSDLLPTPPIVEKKRTQLFARSFPGLSPEMARKQLAELEQHLKPGTRVDLSWVVWTESS